MPAGTLRLTTSEDYGAVVVAPALAAFTERVPQVKVDFVASDKVVDLVSERFDLSIRTGWLRDSRLKAVRVASFRQPLVGAPDYLVAGDLAAGGLVHLLPAHKLPEGGVYVVYPTTRHVQAKVRAFIDFFREYVGVVQRI